MLVLPSLLLAHVQSLKNKPDVLRAKIITQREVRDCCALIFMDTWLSAKVRTAASGKAKGDGVRVFVNNLWCGDIQSVHKHCPPDVELLLLMPTLLSTKGIQCFVFGSCLHSSMS